MKKVMLLLAALLAVKLAAAQNIPPMYGIMKMTYRASSFEMVEDYYGGLLGFEKAFEYRSQEGKVLSYKVNDRQFLEFIEDAQAARKDRFVSISIQTPDVGAMREYLLSRDVAVSQVTIDGAGNRVCSAVDNRGHKVEFIDLNPSSLHSKSAGRFLSARRISARIHHAGLFFERYRRTPAFLD